MPLLGTVFRNHTSFCLCKNWLVTDFFLFFFCFFLFLFCFCFCFFSKKLDLTKIRIRILATVSLMLVMKIISNHYCYANQPVLFFIHAKCPYSYKIWPIFPSYKNQSTALQYKWITWFLYDRNIWRDCVRIMTYFMSKIYYYLKPEKMLKPEFFDSTFSTVVQHF